MPPSRRRRRSGLSGAEEVCLALRAQQGDLGARNRLVEASLPLVRKIARRFRGRGLPFEDLVEEGVLGLIAAFPRYDPARGLDFMLYAGLRIRNAMARAVMETTKPVRLPSYLAAKQPSVRAARQALRLDLQRDPTPEEILRALSRDPRSIHSRLTASLGRAPTWEEFRRECERGQWSVLAVHRILAYEDAFPESRPVESLDSGHIDVPDPRADDGSAALLAAADRERIRRVLWFLDPRAESVVRMHHGLAGPNERALPGFPPRKRAPGATLTLVEIGSLLGLTRERVRQIEGDALREMERRLAGAYTPTWR